LRFNVVFEAFWWRVTLVFDDATVKRIITTPGAGKTRGDVIPRRKTSTSGLNGITVDFFFFLLFVWNKPTEMYISLEDVQERRLTSARG
jgi:hypothetical protein